MLSATAPRRAENVIFSFLSSICRQFLVGLARLAGGSSRESVSTLVETCPWGPTRFRAPNLRSRCRCARPRTRLPTIRGDWRLYGADGLETPQGDPKVLPPCKKGGLGP